MKPYIKKANGIWYITAPFGTSHELTSAAWRWVQWKRRQEKKRRPKH